MKSQILVCFAALILSPLAFGSDAHVPAAAAELFDGKTLAGWTSIVKPGLAADASTWTVADGVLKCSGAPAGYVRTEKAYKNYRLTLDWRWSGPALAPDDQGKPRFRNNGVLLHAQSPDTVWPKCLEAQLMETNAGDIYIIGGAETAEHLAAQTKAVAAAGTDEAARKRASGNRRLPRQHDSSEKAGGEWNTYEIICSGDTVTLFVNGVQQNRVTKISVTEGFIALQSEGAPIEFRNIKLAPLE